MDGIISANSILQELPLTYSLLDLFFGKTKKKVLEKASSEKQVIGSSLQLCVCGCERVFACAHACACICMFDLIDNDEQILKKC